MPVRSVQLKEEGMEGRRERGERGGERESGRGEGGGERWEERREID